MQERTDPNASPVESALDRARRDLVDLTFRNKFLNYRVLKAQGVAVTHDDAERVRKLLVDASATITFLDAEKARDAYDAWKTKRQRGLDVQREVRALPETTPSHGDESTGAPHDLRDGASTGANDEVGTTELVHVTGAEIRRALPDRVLITDHDESNLDQRLFNSARIARTMIEERGVNTLFMALGILRWKPAEQSHTVRESALFFVPVTLERANVPHGYRLRYDGEDVQGNAPLREKLAQESIELPMPKDDEALDAYFGRVRTAIRHRDDWLVDAAHVSLGFFSFTRHLMYMDLDPKRWPSPAAVIDHPVVGQVLGDGFAPEAPLIEEGARLDGTPEFESLQHVLEADGSQSLTIAEAMRRPVLVVQGPPGTGKSQTITNLLAEAVARRQRVLFVAEKKAALDVVARRLDEVGLGPTALVLHSHKATRSAVIRELDATWSADHPKENGEERVRRERDQSRSVLNAYVDALHTPLEPFGETPFAWMARLADTQELEHLDLAAAGIDDPLSWTRERLEAAVNALDLASVWMKEHGSPSRHAFRGARLTIATPMSQRELTSLATDLETAVTSVRDAIRHPALEALQDAFTIEASARTALDVSSALHALRVHVPNANPAHARLWNEPLMASAALDAASALSGDDAWLRRHVDMRALDMTVEQLGRVHADLTRRDDVLYRWFDRRYRHAVRTLDALVHPGIRLDSTERENLAAVLRRHRKALDASQLHLSYLRDVTGEPDPLDRLTDIDAPLRAMAMITASPPAWLDRDRMTMLATMSADELRQRIDATEAAVSAFTEARTRLEAFLELDTTVTFGQSASEHVAMEAWLDAARRWREAASHLRSWTSWSRMRSDLGAVGAASLHGALEREDVSPDKIGARLTRAMQSAWLQAAFTERPALASFELALHEHALEQFQTADAAAIVHARASVARAHVEGMLECAEQGQMAILTKEFHKKRRHLPIRRLMEKAGTAIQAIKPIFMMSPLSAATYLPPGHIEFDLVVFDEASQVRPSDALGALLRAKRAVVVGDDRQLPPTSFFDQLLGEDDDDVDDFGAQDVESVLGLFGAQGAPSRMLEWHYRSRHESLIAVSNHAFYDNRLLLFPSPSEPTDGMGVSLVHLPDSVYDRGKSRTNADEARAVAEAVLEHVRTRPHQTLGVAALSKAQADRLYAEVDRLRRRHPEIDAFDARHESEPLFVKNLETIQGDERDVVIVSIGYGRDEHGRLHYNFGPLNNVGGERRLNVLISRSRLATRVFTNFTDEDMDPAKCTSFGVRALRTYLKYARTRELGTPDVGARDDDSPFEDAVARELTKLGYRVARQVGEAGYSIDLAIADPERPGRFVIGIECDGATYHSTRSARDRDRLRQAVLEGLGWRIHRIWSTHWFLDRQDCLKRASAAIEEALSERRRHAEPGDPSAALASGTSGARDARALPVTVAPTSAPSTLEREPDQRTLDDAS